MNDEDDCDFYEEKNHNRSWNASLNRLGFNPALKVSSEGASLSAGGGAFRAAGTATPKDDEPQSCRTQRQIASKINFSRIFVNRQWRPATTYSSHRCVGWTWSRHHWRGTAEIYNSKWWTVLIHAINIIIMIRIFQVFVIYCFYINYLNPE